MKKTKKRIDRAFGKKIYLLGVDSNGNNVWLEEPCWDCGWYWGFGYIERYTNNKNPSRARDITCHTHWDFEIYGKHENGEFIHHLNQHPDFTSTVLTDKESWELADLMKSYYTLREMAEIFHSGSSHLTSNTEISLKDADLERHINDKLLPAIFARIDKILTPEIKEDK